MNVFDLCEKSNSNELRFTVDPSVMYPVVLSRLERVKQGHEPRELYGRDGKADEGAKRLIAELRSMPDDMTIDNRNQWLELARKWFTKSLKVRTHGPITIRITRNSAWKLL